MNTPSFSYSMLGYIPPITISVPHIYRRNPYTTHIFKPTHQTGLTPDTSIVPPRNISERFTIIWDLSRFLQPGLISSTIFCKKLYFPTVNHNTGYIKLHWTQFPNTGNT